MKGVVGFNKDLVQALASGDVAVLRTDTIYGIVAKADNEAAVERVYHIKGRTPTKSPIVLIARPEDMFDTYSEMELSQFRSLWPGKNSIILPSKKAPEWIVRGNASVAYRIPNDEHLRSLLEKTSPLIAPSANPEGVPPALDIDEARDYFGDKIRFYIDGGIVTDNTPSRLYRMTNDGMERLR